MTCASGRFHIPPLRRVRCVYVRIAVGICDSDLHHFREGSTGDDENTEPFVLGHEIAAEVLPKSAEQLGLEAGAIVALDPAHPCGEL